MDTLDTFAPRRRASSETLNRDTAVDGDAMDDSIAREADANPDADFDTDPENLAPVSGPEAPAGAEKVNLNRWQIAGLIAGGVALVAGVAGAVYLRQQAQSPKARMKAQAQKIKSQADRLSLPKIDFSQAHPRRLSHVAARKIESLPVRQVQKRVAHRVAHLFD